MGADVAHEAPAQVAIETLSREECLRRLAGAELGRLAVVIGHYPHVFPVNFRLDEHVVVFRTNIGTKLLAANHGNVAFQVDEIDLRSHSGWSVLVKGMAEDVTDLGGTVHLDRAERLGVVAWAGGERSRLVRIIPAEITGREVRPEAAPT